MRMRFIYFTVLFYYNENMGGNVLNCHKKKVTMQKITMVLKTVFIS